MSAERADYVSRLWRNWFAWSRDASFTMANDPWDSERGVWVGWDRTADAAGDGPGLAALLHRIAAGTEPVWQHAGWTVDGHGVPQDAPRLLSEA